MNKTMLILRPILLGLALFVITLAVVLSLGSSQTLAQEVSPTEIEAASSVMTAYVVVQFADHDAIVRPITFTTPISGYRALELAGLSPALNGEQLCSIDDYGNCNPSSPWSAWYWHNSAWTARSQGVKNTIINQDGHVEAFAWGSAAPLSSAPEIQAAQKGLDWLHSQQSVDGGYHEGGWGTSAGGAVDSMLAVSANRYDPAEWRRSPGDASMLDYLTSGSVTIDYAKTRVAAPAKMVIGLVGGGHADDVTNFAGLNLVMSITQYYVPDEGIYVGYGGSHTHNWDQSWAILGLVAAGQDVPAKAVQILAARPNADGGFGWADDITSDVDSTGLVMQALVAGGTSPSSQVIVNAVTFLQSAQNADGGFPGIPGDSSDTNATSWAVQGIIAAGQDPGAWKKNGHSPLDFIRSTQRPDGQFYWQVGQEGSKFLSTQQAVPVLLGHLYPLNGKRYTIAGRVTETTSNPLNDAIVTAGEGCYSRSGVDGYYVLTGVDVGSYDVAPFKSGYVFNPTHRSISVPLSSEGQNFTAVPDTKTTNINTSGGSLTNDDASLSVQFPANAVGGNTQVTYTGLVTTTAGNLPDGVWVRSFTLAATSGGSPLSELQKAYTIVIKYTPAQLAALGINNEMGLKVFYWDGNQWLNANASVDPGNDQVTVTLSRLAEFALVGGPAGVYLPWIVL